MGAQQSVTTSDPLPAGTSVTPASGTTNTNKVTPTSSLPVPGSSTSSSSSPSLSAPLASAAPTASSLLAKPIAAGALPKVSNKSSPSGTPHNRGSTPSLKTVGGLVTSPTPTVAVAAAATGGGGTGTGGVEAKRNGSLITNGSAAQVNKDAAAGTTVASPGTTPAGAASPVTPGTVPAAIAAIERRLSQSQEAGANATPIKANLNKRLSASSPPAASSASSSSSSSSLSSPSPSSHLSSSSSSISPSPSMPTATRSLTNSAASPEYVKALASYPGVQAAGFAPVSVTSSSSSSSSSSNSSSSSSSSSSDPSGLYYQLVEWTAAFLPVGVVLAWDEESVEKLVLGIPESKEMLDGLLKQQQERKRKRKQSAAAAKASPNTLSTSSSSSISISSASTSSPDSLGPLPPPPFDIPYDLASQLLSCDKILSKLRLTWVPSRVSEDTFWLEYFGHIVEKIKTHVMATQEQIKKHTIQGPAAVEPIVVVTPITVGAQAKKP